MRNQRIAVISDLHGHLPGLLAVFAEIEAREVHRVVCLGDLVDGGPDSLAVIDEVMRRGIPCVRGNHDEHPSVSLPPAQRDRLAALPEVLEEDGLLYTHISPRVRKRKILDVYEAWNVFDETTARRIFVGHAHIPMLYGEKADSPATATEYPIVYREPFALDPADRYLICVGAVGYARDGVHYPRYVIYDSGLDTLETGWADAETLRFDGRLS